MAIDLKNYNLTTQENNLIEACQDIEKQTHLTPEDKVLYLNYLINILNLKQQKKIIDDQNKFNTKLVKTNRNLVVATWALAFVTILLCIITIFKKC